MALTFADVQKLAQSLWTGGGSVALDPLALRNSNQGAIIHHPSGASASFDLTRKDLERAPQAFGEQVLAPALAALKEKIGG
ncbi:MAG: hypothetical protein P4L76_17745 [Beijerinckiaceae bacterium]|nr:hypothetical protein [Beijerinckiaceae bacterium]